jgi:hypothetical protein
MQNGLCDGLALNFRRVSKSGFMIALESGIETLRSKTDILYAVDTSTPVAASGSTTLKVSFLYLTPFIGYRYPIKGVTMDVMAGLDLGHCLKMAESGRATDVSGKVYRADRSLNTPKGDVRSRIQIGACYGRFSVFTGYCIGLSSYLPANMGGSSDCTSRLWRFGLCYRLNTVDL